MKTLHTPKLAVTLTLISLVGSVWAVDPPLPGAGMRYTKHDFTPDGWWSPSGDVVVGLCSICHTPHSAITQKLLWNQKLTTQTFTWSGLAKTEAGTALPNFAHTGASTYCLSCHDGSVTMGDVAMYKGKSGWMDAQTGMGKMGAANVNRVNLGANSGAHPIAVPYPLNNQPGTYNSITSGDQTVLAEFMPNPHSPTTGAVKLYNVDGDGVIRAGAVQGASGIECTSCHDGGVRISVCEAVRW